ncbi:MAG: biotin/lipoate protein ligase [Sporomusa sp.]|jgi:lipoate-protein ligase A|nr:biotin/lipoate protein ligase [Sporomusa sp.]
MMQYHELRERLIESGVDHKELKDITVVGDWFSNGDSKSVLQDPFQQAAIPLLLPYCAKNIACKFRYTAGCGRCGECDIGEAYTLADEYGMEPITIQNYEMLEEQLENLKKSGCKFFIGTCCERFWVKHRLDFERIGLPGILVNVDNSTCYDFGKDQKAYKGKFENQVQLKNQFIRRVLHGIINSSKPPA